MAWVGCCLTRRRASDTLSAVTIFEIPDFLIDKEINSQIIGSSSRIRTFFGCTLLIYGDLYNCMTRNGKRSVLMYDLQEFLVYSNPPLLHVLLISNFDP